MPIEYGIDPDVAGYDELMDMSAVSTIESPSMLAFLSEGRPPPRSHE